MFEDKIDTLREHIDHLREFLADGWEEDADLEKDELLSELESFEEDIQDLKDDLPYDEVDEYGEDIEDFSGDNLEEGELEDELVEAEGVIEELEELIQEVRNRLDEDEEFNEESPSETRHFVHITGTVIKSKEELSENLKTWIVGALKEKNSQAGITETEDVISRRAIALLLGIKDHLDPGFPVEATLTPDREYDYTSEEISAACNHSVPIYRIALGLGELYDIWCKLNIKDDYVFESVLANVKRVWLKYYERY